MKKIFIVRERLDWHNCDPHDETTAYATRELAEAGLAKKVEEVMHFFQEEELELYDDMTKIESDYARMTTERDDWYSCWIDEIEMFY